jgi:hypothetical protein
LHNLPLSYRYPNSCTAILSLRENHKNYELASFYHPISFCGFLFSYLDRPLEKLAEAIAKGASGAIETDKPERANAIAIILASRIGYNDYRQLLKDVRGNISTAIPRR